MGRHLTTPITAYRNHSEPFPFCRIGERVHVRLRHMQYFTHDLVRKPAIRPRATTSRNWVISKCVCNALTSSPTRIVQNAHSLSADDLMIRCSRNRRIQRCTHRGLIKNSRRRTDQIVRRCRCHCRVGRIRGLIRQSCVVLAQGWSPCCCVFQRWPSHAG